jgi:diguanylate cyclase (GGDEF)-like protein
MMRSLIENHIGDFLQILTFEKSLWKDFWDKLPYKPLTERYASYFESFYEKLSSIPRNELTEFSHDYEAHNESLKEELSIRIRKNARDLNLAREDFVIYLMAGIGEKDWVVVEGKREKVIMFDAFALWKKGKFLSLPDAVYQAVVHFRHGETEGNYYDKSELFKYMKDEISRMSNENILKNICMLLDKHVPYYNWTGFYLMDEEGMLLLGPYVGEPTEHVRIPVGKGICGQAAQTKLTFLVQDVSQETNYLSCSSHVKSEIVVPILRNDGSVYGEIDIDSHFIAPFDERDRDFLEWIAKQLLVRAVHWKDFDRRIKIAYLDSYISYILSEIVKYNIQFSVELYVHHTPENVPENLYKMWRIARRLPNAKVEKLIVVDNIEDQKVGITTPCGTIVLNYHDLNQTAQDILRKIITESSEETSKILFSIHHNAVRLAQSFLNTQLITQYVLKPESDINTILYAFLTGITAGYSGSFNRAMFFYYAEKQFLFKKALGPRTMEEATGIWEAIEDIELNMADFLETVSKDFKSSLEIVYDGKVIKEECISQYLDGSAHIVSKSALPEIAEEFDISKEFVLMALKSGEKLLGLLIADNNFDGKPISEYQLNVIENLGHQMALVIENRRFIESIKEKAEIDSLTGLRTRRSFEEFVTQPPLQEFSLVFIDINKFKMINDIYGHEKGDEVLKKFGKCINLNIRKSDLAFRYGGDEAVLILNSVDMEIVKKVVGRILECFKNSAEMTFSAGVAAYPMEGSVQKVLKIADERNYKSKLSGNIEF